jgi:uncharacterized protein (TIGR02145 family)
MSVKQNIAISISAALAALALSDCGGSKGAAPAACSADGAGRGSAVMRFAKASRMLDKDDGGMKRLRDEYEAYMMGKLNGETVGNMRQTLCSDRRAPALGADIMELKSKYGCLALYHALILVTEDIFVDFFEWDSEEEWYVANEYASRRAAGGGSADGGGADGGGDKDADGDSDDAGADDDVPLLQCGFGDLSHIWDALPSLDAALSVVDGMKERGAVIKQIDNWLEASAILHDKLSYYYCDGYYLSILCKVPQIRRDFCADGNICEDGLCRDLPSCASGNLPDKIKIAISRLPDDERKSVYKSLDGIIADISKDKEIVNYIKRCRGESDDVIADGRTSAEGQISVDGLTSDDEQISFNERTSTDTQTTSAATDGKTFRSVKIGNQVWMAENLNIPIGDSRCYDNKDSNCDKYGRLYDWNTAKKACPAGWHLPTVKEWDALLRFAGGAETAAEELKSESPDWDGADKFGFSALPGGFSLNGRIFLTVGDTGNWWTSTEHDAINASYRGMGAGNTVDQGFNNKDNGYSVRCVRD